MLKSNPMKDYQEKTKKTKKAKKQLGYRTPDRFRRKIIREAKTMGARPRALGGHQ